MYTATADYPHVGLNYELKVFGFLYDSARSIVSGEKKIMSVNVATVAHGSQCHKHTGGMGSQESWRLTTRFERSNICE